MCGPIYSDLVGVGLGIINHNMKARQTERGRTPMSERPNCSSCYQYLVYIAEFGSKAGDKYSKDLSILAKGLLKAGKETTIGDPPCVGTNLAFRHALGIDDSIEAQKAYEFYMSIGVNI